MKPVISIHKAEEYVVVSALIILTFFCAVLAVFVNSDPVIIITTVALLAAGMIYAEQLKPIHFFYTICFGASFLPYINLKMFPLASVYVIAFIFIILTLISFLRSGKKIYLPQPAKWMFLFLAIGVISVAGAPDKRQVIIYVGQFFVYIAVYVAAVNLIESKSQIIRSIRYVLYGSIIPMLACLIQLILSFNSLRLVIDVFYESMWGRLLIGSRGLERLSGSEMDIINRASNVGGELGDVLFRVFGTYVGPTGFGSYILVITILAGTLFLVQKNKKRIAFSWLGSISFFGVLSLTLFLTWTRSAWLAFFVVLAFILVYRNEQHIAIFSKKNITLFLLIILIPFVLFVVLWVFKVPIAATVLLSITTLSGVGGSVVSRLGTMLFSLQYMAQHPLDGIGWGNFGHANPNLTITSSEATFASAHNRYLELGVELGLPGLIAYLLIIFSFIKQALQLIKAPLNTFYHTLGIAFLAIWLGFLITSMFGGSVIHPRTMTLLWTIAGIQTAAYLQFIHAKKKEHTVYRLETAH